VDARTLVHGRGCFDDHHALLVGQLLTRLEHTDSSVRALDADTRRYHFERNLT